MTRRTVLILLGAAAAIAVAVAVLRPSRTARNGDPSAGAPAGASVEELETELRDIEAIQR